MGALKVTIVGGRELAAKLNQLSDEVAGKALERALVAGGLEIVNQAKVNAPWLTGNLRRSLHVGGYPGEKPGLEQPTTGTDIGGNRNTRNSAEVLVGTNVEYAAPVEMGHHGWAGHPYLRPAADTEKEQVAKTIGGALGDLIKAAVR